MLSKRLLAIAKLVKSNANILDVGTDHAYLPIYLRKNALCKNIIASDLSPSALKVAQKNIDKYKASNIDLQLSDGLKDIKGQYDTLIISGMGARTMITILEKGSLPANIILSANNNLYELRRFMNKLGYQIETEVALYENKQYYDIISYHKGKEKLSKCTLKYGKSNNKDYYQYLFTKQKEIFNRLNLKNKIKKLPSLIELKIISI